MTLWNEVKEEIQLARVAATQSRITYRDQWEMQKNVGQHIIFDWYFHEKDIHHLVAGCDNEQNILNTYMKDACEECGATVLSSNSRGFGEECGFTYAIILAESHATCHTWPEYGLATFDIFTCGTVDTKSIMKQFLRKLKASDITLKRYEEQLINRGFVYDEYDVNQIKLDID